MHYSPVRRSSAPEGLLPLDLHVLSLPPAFNLSHDQTLQFNLFEAEASLPCSRSNTHQNRRALSLMICVQTISVSAHTNCLVNLLKSFRTRR